MGNCFKKEEDKYAAMNGSSSDEKTSNKDSVDRSLVSSNTYADTQHLEEIGRAKRISSLCIKPGEEALFSKKINIDEFEIDKVLGKGNFGKVYLAK